MKDFIAGIPKIELHLHIEGSLEPELLFALAQRNGIDIPYESVEELTEAYSFNCLQDFLDIYYKGASVLIHEQDFYDLTMAYLERCREDNVVHTEIFFDPQTHTERGIDIGVPVRGIKKALNDAHNQWGITSGLIFSFLRHLSEEEAFEVWELAQPYLNEFIGVGLDSSEAGNPPQKFEGIYAKAREAGMRLVAHAGEEGPAQYITDALDLLKVERIDHGVRCLEDAELVARLVREEVPLTVCPTSNIALCVFETMKDHNFKKLMDAGLKVTINSDDPAYFGGYMTENFLQIQEAFDLTKDEIRLLCLNAAEASFLPSNEKESLCQKIAKYN